MQRTIDNNGMTTPMMVSSSSSSSRITTTTKPPSSSSSETSLPKRDNKNKSGVVAFGKVAVGLLAGPPPSTASVLAFDDPYDVKTMTGISAGVGFTRIRRSSVFTAGVQQQQQQQQHHHQDYLGCCPDPDIPFKLQRPQDQSQDTTNDQFGEAAQEEEEEEENIHHDNTNRNDDDDVLTAAKNKEKEVPCDSSSPSFNKRGAGSIQIDDDAAEEEKQKTPRKLQQKESTKFKKQSDDDDKRDHVPPLSSNSSSSGTAVYMPYGYIPTDKDILCGRRKQNMKHPAKKAYMDMIRNCRRDSYTKAKSRIEKSIAIQTLVQDIHEAGLRFIQLDNESHRYVELNDDQIHSKVGHSIRDILKYHNIKPKKTAVKEKIGVTNPQHDAKRDARSGNDDDNKDEEEERLRIYDNIRRRQRRSTLLKASEGIYRLHTPIDTEKDVNRQRLQEEESFDGSITGSTTSIPKVGASDGCIGINGPRDSSGGDCHHYRQKDDKTAFHPQASGDMHDEEDDDDDVIDAFKGFAAAGSVDDHLRTQSTSTSIRKRKVPSPMTTIKAGTGALLGDASFKRPRKSMTKTRRDHGTDAIRNITNSNPDQIPPLTNTPMVIPRVFQGKNQEKELLPEDFIPKPYSVIISRDRKNWVGNFRLGILALRLLPKYASGDSKQRSQIISSLVNIIHEACPEGAFISDVVVANGAATEKLRWYLVSESTARSKVHFTFHTLMAWNHQYHQQQDLIRLSNLQCTTKEYQPDGSSMEKGAVQHKKHTPKRRVDTNPIQLSKGETREFSIERHSCYHHRETEFSKFEWGIQKMLSTFKG